MKKSIGIIAIAAIVVLSIANAQVVQPQPQPIEYSFTLKTPMVETIGKALGLLPYNEAHSVMTELQLQINRQLEAAQKKAAPATPEKK